MLNVFLKNKYWRRWPVDICLLITLLVLSVGPSLARAQAVGPEYVVQEGDTLYSIALSFGVTVDALQQINGIADPSLLTIGQKLIIPGYEGIGGTLVTYRVQLGETLPGLAKRFGATEEILIRLNRLTSADDDFHLGLHAVDRSRPALNLFRSGQHLAQLVVAQLHGQLFRPSECAFSPRAGTGRPRQAR